VTETCQVFAIPARPAAPAGSGASVAIMTAGLLTWFVSLPGVAAAAYHKLFCRASGRDYRAALLGSRTYRAIGWPLTIATAVLLVLTGEPGPAVWFVAITTCVVVWAHLSEP
jgi:hypothetical protein